MQTFYANSIEGCVLCSPDALPQGGNWIVSDSADNVIRWLHDASEDSQFFKVSTDVLIEVGSVFGFRTDIHGNSVERISIPIDDQRDRECLISDQDREHFDADRADRIRDLQDRGRV